MTYIWAIVVSIVILVVFTFIKVFYSTMIDTYKKDHLHELSKEGYVFLGITEIIPLIIAIILIKIVWKKITYKKQVEINSNSKNNSLESKNTINNPSSSLVKAVYNHTKDIANEIKPTINEYKEKHQTNKTDTSNISSINEDEIYEKVLLEIEENNKVKSTWARALAQSEGNKDKAESIYIKERVLIIQKENFKLKDNFDSNPLNNTQIRVETFHDKIPICSRKDELNLFMEQEGLHLVNYISEEEVICQPNNGPIEKKVIYLKDKWQYSNSHYYPEIAKPPKDLRILSKLETNFLDKYNVNKNDKNVHIFLDEIIIELEEGNKKYIRCKN